MVLSRWTVRSGGEDLRVFEIRLEQRWLCAEMVRELPTA
jgi:hypothetical protein